MNPPPPPPPPPILTHYMHTTEILRKLEFLFWPINHWTNKIFTNCEMDIFKFDCLAQWLIQNISPILNQRLSFFCKFKKNCKRNTLSRSTGKLTADVVYRAKAWGLAIKQFDSNHFFFSKKDEIIKISCNRQPNSIKSKNSQMPIESFPIQSYQKP